MRILKWFQQRDAEMSVRVGKARNNTVRLTGAACTGSFLLGCGKLIVGVLSASFFTCANAFYTFGKYSLQGTTQGRYLTGGVPPVRFSM